MFGRLEPKDTAKMRRDADGTAHIAADFQRREAGGNCRCAAACAAAWRAAGIPRIVGAVKDRAVRLRSRSHCRQIGLAENNGPGLAQSCNDRSILLRNVIG